MANGITITGVDEARVRIERMSQGMTRAAGEGAFAGAAYLLARMKSNMLSGQRLRVRTGKLRSNWSLTLPAVVGDAIESRATTNTVYAPVQEYGFHGAVHVREHPRREPKKKRQKIARTAKRAGTQPQYTSSSVRAHTRNVSIRAKYFLRDTVRNERQAARDVILRIMRRHFDAS